MGDTIKLEKLSYRAFQRRFGRSVGMRAPGMFVERLKRKAESAGATVVEFPTHTTRLSQTCPQLWEGSQEAALAAVARMRVWNCGPTGFVCCLPRDVRGRGTAQRGPRTTCVAGCGRAPPGGVERHSTGKWAASAVQLWPGSRPETEPVACES